MAEQNNKAMKTDLTIYFYVRQFIIKEVTSGALGDLKMHSVVVSKVVSELAVVVVPPV